MLSRNLLQEYISCKFPDLLNTKFEINGEKISNFYEAALLPFLVYQNTVDKEHRLITLFLPDNCTSSNMLPFYVIIGQYRKALDSILKRNNYKSQTFPPQQKLVINRNKSICYISSVNYINRTIIIKEGGGYEQELSFDNNYQLQYYNSALDIKTQIDAFARIDKANKQNLFTLPINPRNELYEGVIIFTNTSKFETLLKNIKVDKNDLRAHLNVQKVIYTGNDKEPFKFVRISAAATEKKPVSVLFARKDAFKAYNNIIEAGKGKINHIKTIIIDDFDELYDKWQRSDSLQEHLEFLKENYLQDLKVNNLKDVYLLCSNTRLHIHQGLTSSNISNYPWLLKPEQEFEIQSRDKLFSQKIKVFEVCNHEYSAVHEKLYDLISQWRLLAEKNFLNGEIIIPINSLYDLLNKIESFIDPDQIDFYVQKLSCELDTLKKNWFFNGSDFGLISKTNEFCKDCLTAHRPAFNSKLARCIDFIQKGTVSGCVQVVSDNSDPTDIEYLKKKLSTSGLPVSVTHVFKRDLIKNNFCYEKDLSLVVYLTSDKNLPPLALANSSGVNQAFFLSKRKYHSFKYLSKGFQKLQTRLSNKTNQFTLLNIDEPSTAHEQEEKPSITIEYEPCVNATPASSQEEPFEFPEFETSIKDIIQRQAKAIDSEIERQLLFFDDTSYKLLPVSKKVFKYEDDKELNDLNELETPVSELRIGDQIIFAKTDIPLIDILKTTLETNPLFSKAFEMDQKWRLLINNHIKRTGMDLDYFRKKLNREGFEIISNGTIKNWIEGKTRRPDNFGRLLLALKGLKILNEAELKEFNHYNQDIKDVQLGFVRTAIIKIVAKINGIDLVEEEEFFPEALLESFINHIEIKKIIAKYTV